MLLFRAITAIAGVAIVCSAVSQGQEKKIELTLVKYDGLKQEVLKHRGKVVVLDFWATTCVPCLAHFPDVVEMQKKYADKGLVVISVSLDKTDEDTVKRANRFLTQQKTPFANLLLDEPPEVLAKQFEFKGLPFYYVFDRHGKWVRYRSFDYKTAEAMYEEIDKTVVKMLGEK
jgi:thiol-disulfide isomerase/thioredoxin